MSLPRISAAELMTENPRTVRANDSVGEAVEVLQATDFRHLPVVDEQGDLVGMLSDRDIRALELPYSQDAETVGTVLLKARVPVSSMMNLTRTMACAFIVLAGQNNVAAPTAEPRPARRCGRARGAGRHHEAPHLLRAARAVRVWSCRDVLRARTSSAPLRARVTRCSDRSGAARA